MYKSLRLKLVVIYICLRPSLAPLLFQFGFPQPILGRLRLAHVYGPFTPRNRRGGFMLWFPALPHVHHFLHNFLLALSGRRWELRNAKSPPNRRLLQQHGDHNLAQRRGRKHQLKSARLPHNHRKAERGKEIQHEVLCQWANGLLGETARCAPIPKLFILAIISYEGQTLTRAKRCIQMAMATGRT
jgi:hypothetical protein